MDMIHVDTPETSALLVAADPSVAQRYVYVDAPWRPLYLTTQPTASCSVITGGPAAACIGLESDGDTAAAQAPN